MKYHRSILGIIIGGISGYAYYYFVGCSRVSCLIASKPLNSVVYFSIMGVLAINIFNKK